MAKRMKKMTTRMTMRPMIVQDEAERRSAANSAMACALTVISRGGTEAVHVPAGALQPRRRLVDAVVEGCESEGTTAPTFAVQVPPYVFILLLRARNSRSSPADVLDTIRTIANVGW